MPPQEGSSDGPQLENGRVEPEIHFQLSELEEEVKARVAAEQPLTEIKADLLRGIKVDDEENNILESLFAHELLESLPSKLSVYFERLLSFSDSDIVIQWLEAFVEGMTEERLRELFHITREAATKDTDGISGQEAKFASNLEDVRHLLPNSAASTLLREARRHFFSTFDRHLELRGELGIYRSLRACSTSIPRSELFCVTVQRMWKACINTDEDVAIAAENDAEEHLEHHIFKRVIDTLPSEFHADHQFVIDMIKSLFHPLKYEIIVEGGNRILQLHGRQLTLSHVLEKVNETLEHEKEELNEIRFVAETSIVVDADLQMPSKNISIIAPKVQVTAACEWDLSGVDAQIPSYWKEKAENGKREGEDGENGIHGVAGGSSGRVEVRTKEIVNSERWTVKLCGGAGTRGQNGGDGADGKPGKGRNYDDVFDSKFYAVCSVATSGTTFLTFGLTARLVSATTETFQDKILDDGVRVINSISAHNISTHFFRAYLGTAGQPGGRGGENGRGGQGGYKGTFVALTPEKKKLSHAVTVKADNGKDGADGEPGKRGNPGVDGHDVVAACTATESWYDFGTKSNNKKIKIDWNNKNEAHCYYVPKKYTGSGSYCYITAVDPKPVRQYTSADRQSEKKSDSERQGEAIAKKTNAINSSAIDGNYDEAFAERQEEKTVEQNLEQEAEKNTETQMNRLAIRIDVPHEAHYVPKKRLELPELSNEDKKLITESKGIPGEHFWSTPLEWSVAKELKVGKADGDIVDRLKRKVLISMLRRLAKEQRSSRGQFAAAIKEFVRRKKTAESKETFMETIVQDARLAHETEKRHRDCRQFLSSFEHDHSGMDMCIDVLFDEKRGEKFVSEALKKVSIQRLCEDTFTTLSDLLETMKTIQLKGKPIEDYIQTCENIIQAYEEGNSKSAHKKFKEFSKSVSREEWKELETCWKRIVKESQPSWDRQDYEDLRIPFCQSNKRLRFIHAFVRLNNTITTNREHLNALKLVARLMATEEQRATYPNLFGDDATDAVWLQLFDSNQKLREEYEKIIDEFGVKSSAGRALVAWKTKVNLRFYAEGRLIEDHYPESPASYHIEITPEKGEFRLLVFDKEKLKLLMEREKKAAVFEKFMKTGESQRILNLDAPTELEEDVEKLLRSVNGDENLCSSLFLFTYEYCECARPFFRALLAIFDVDGVHVDAEDVQFMVDTAMRVCARGNVHPWTFARLVLSDSQDEWLDVFFLLNVEGAWNKKVKRLAEFRQRTRRIVDTRLKILIAQKLQTEIIQEAALLELLGFLKHAHGAYKELRLVPLAGWIAVVRESHTFYLLNGKEANMTEERRKQLVFWCMKIAEAYDVAEAENVFELISTQEFPVEPDQFFILKLGNEEKKMNYVAMARLVQLVCNKEFDAKTTLTPTVIFRELCRALVDGKEQTKKFKKMAISDEQVFDVHKILRHLCEKLTKIERTVETLFRLIRSNNLPVKKQSEQEKKEKTDFNTDIGDNREEMKVDEPSEEQLKAEETVAKRRIFIDQLEALIISSDHIKQFASSYVAKLKKAPNTLPKTVFEEIQQASQKIRADENMLLLEVVDEAVLTMRGFRLRNNQKVAVLSALKSNGISKCGLLQQIATGEGKSLIITSLAIISVLKGRNVHIITSSSTLAKRDTESEPPRGCTDIYQLFGIKSGHICVEDTEKRQEVYASAHIVYGDLTSFQRDYLLDKFYGMNIMGSSGFGTMLVDEVDSMLLDQGNNMLYLSHEIPDLEFLQPLFVRIWQMVCSVIENSEVEEISSEDIVRAVSRSVFPSLPLDDLQSQFAIDIVKAFAIRELLINSKLVDENGFFLNESLISWKAELSKLKDAKLETRLMFMVEQALKQEYVAVPRHLKGFVKHHVVDFVENARNAYFMDEGAGYQVDMARSEVTINYEPKVVIVEQSTGVDLPSTQWNNGLHQFIQLKHGLRLTPMSLKAVFVSNVSYLKKYECIYGFSGTLGAEAEQTQLRTLYHVECLRLPSSVPKLFHEDCSEVVKSRAEYVDEVFMKILEKLQARRSVLIICDSIRSVNKLSSDLKTIALRKLQKNKTYLDSFEKAILYRRDRDAFEYGDGNRELECHKVIFSTNLAGRGTDIKLCKELANNGGLHVIVAFLPDNVRVEEQAFGRAARCGEPGSAQLIIHNANQSLEPDISRLKFHRNATEAKRVLAITNFYKSNIQAEENCFREFTNCFDKHRQAIEQKVFSEEEEKLLLRDLLDRWAYWLDGQTKSKVDGKTPTEERLMKITEAARNFCEKLELENWRPLQPMNRLRWGILQLLANKLWKSTEEDFDYVLTNYPDFAAEAKYYKACLVIKQNSIDSAESKPYKKVKALFEDARRMLNARTSQCYSDRAVVEHFKKQDKRKLFIVDLFSKQQMEIAQMYQVFIASMEALIGGRMSHEDLMSTFVTEEVASAVFDKFSDHSFFERLPIAHNHFAVNYDNVNVNDLAMAFATTEDVVRTKLGELEKLKENVVEDSDFLKVFTMPHREEFWQELQRLGCLSDEKKHIFVNKAKFEKLNEKLVEKIQKCTLSKPKIDAENSSNTNTPTANATETVTKQRLPCLFLQNFSEELFEECDEKKLREELKEEIYKRLILIKVLVETNSAEFKESERVMRPPAPDPSYMAQVKENATAFFKSKKRAVGVGRKDEVVEVHQVPEDTADNLQVEDFERFSYVTIDDIKSAGIPSSEAEEVFAALSNRVLVLDAEKKFRLHPAANLSGIEELPSCYLPLLEKLLKQRCAYVLAYRKLCESLKDGEPLEIAMPSRDDVLSQFNDLIECGVIEHANVDFEGLRSSQVGDGAARRWWNWMKDGDESRNVECITEAVRDQYTRDVLTQQEFEAWRERQTLVYKAMKTLCDAAEAIEETVENMAEKWERAVEILANPENLSLAENSKKAGQLLLECTVPQTMLTVVGVETKPEKERKQKPNKSGPYDALVNKATTAHIVALFRDKSGMQKFETIDAELVELWNKLGEAGLLELRANSLYVMHGSTHVMNIVEKKWSFWTKLKLAAVGVFALVQLAVGTAILIFSCGAGVMVANAFISEGISDLLYTLQGAISGHPGSYKQHKLTSFTSTAVLGVVSAYCAWGKAFNPVAHGLQGLGETVTTASGTMVNFVTLKGMQLIEEVSGKNVWLGARKLVLKRITSAFLSFGIFQAIQWALKNLVESIVKALRTRIVAGVEAALKASGKLVSIVQQALKDLGVSKGTKLVDDCCSRVLSKNVDGLFDSLCEVVFVQYRPIIQSFASGAAQGMSHGGGDVQAALAAKIQLAMQAATVVLGAHCFLTLESRIRELTTDFVDLVTSQLESEKKKTDAMGKKGEESEPHEGFEKVAEKLVSKWHDKMGAQIDKTIELRIVNPLLSLAAAKLQSMLENVVAKGYQKFMAHLDKKQLEKAKAQFEAEKQNDKLGKEEARQHFEERMEKISENTCSPEVIALLINAGMKIDMTAASASANLLARIYKQPVKLIITNGEGKAYTHEAGGPPGGSFEVKTIVLDLCNQHYEGGEGQQANTSRNSCLYEALCAVAPELRGHFENDQKFRKELAETLRTDPYFVEHIQNGWHSIAVQRGYLGGKKDPLYNPKLSISELDNNRKEWEQKDKEAKRKAEAAKSELKDFLVSRMKAQHPNKRGYSRKDDKCNARKVDEFFKEPRSKNEIEKFMETNGIADVSVSKDRSEAMEKIEETRKVVTNYEVTQEEVAKTKQGHQDAKAAYNRHPMVKFEKKHIGEVPPTRTEMVKDLTEIKEVRKEYSAPAKGYNTIIHDKAVVDEGIAQQLGKEILSGHTGTFDVDVSNVKVTHAKLDKQGNLVGRSRPREFKANVRLKVTIERGQMKNIHLVSVQKADPPRKPTYIEKHDRRHRKNRK